MSHEYKPRYNDWYIFTLTVRRMPHNPTQLTGDITARSWCCGREKQQPPLCPPGQFHWVVFMTGAGTANGQQIRFGGTSWRVQEVVCGYGPGGYNLDQFSGTIDPALQEFQSINNDGGRSVNEPTVFRRIRCLDQAQQQHVPHVKVAPPPLRPPRGGCGL